MDDLEELLRRNDDDPDFGADLDDENEIAEFIRANPIPPKTAPVDRTEHYGPLAAANTTGFAPVNALPVEPSHLTTPTLNHTSAPSTTNVSTSTPQPRPAPSAAPEPRVARKKTGGGIKWGLREELHNWETWWDADGKVLESVRGTKPHDRADIFNQWRAANGSLPGTRSWTSMKQHTEELIKHGITLESLRAKVRSGQ